MICFSMGQPNAYIYITDGILLFGCVCVRSGVYLLGSSRLIRFNCRGLLPRLMRIRKPGSSLTLFSLWNCARFFHLLCVVRAGMCFVKRSLKFIRRKILCWSDAGKLKKKMNKNNATHIHDKCIEINARLIKTRVYKSLRAARF